MSFIIRNPSSADFDQLAKLLIDDGAVVIIPTDTVYGLAGKAFDHNTFNRLEQIKGHRTDPYVLVFSSSEKLEEWYGELDSFRRRIIRTLLPGPVTFILPSEKSVPKDFRYAESGIGVRVSSDPIMSELTDRLGFPLWVTSANRSGETAPTNFKDISSSLLHDVDLAIDGGMTSFQQSSSVVDLRRQPFCILRRGPWMERITQALTLTKEPLRVLVICTGNICRSPIGSALLQKAVAPPEESGIVVTSAGTYAVEGYPATQMMVDIALEWGVDLSEHRSRQITLDMIKESDMILAMAPNHRDYVISKAPQSIDKVRFFTETIGEDTVPDPFNNCSRETYRTVAEMIRRAAEGWRVELATMAERAGSSEDN